MTPAEKANYIERVLRTEAIIQHQIRTDGIVKLARAELQRRSPQNKSSRPTLNDSATTDLSALAPKAGDHPIPSRNIPEQLLTAIVNNDGQLDSQEVPEWVAYSLALTMLESSRREDDVNVWETVEEELKRCRRKLRDKLGLPDEHEGKEERHRRLMEEAGKKPSFGKNGRMTNMNWFVNLM